MYASPITLRKEFESKSIVLRPPLPGRLVVTSGYGNRVFRGVTQAHPAVDLAAPIGTLVFAPFAGRVLRVKALNAAGKPDGYGHRLPDGSWDPNGGDVVISHVKGFWTRLSHLSRALVNVGDTVEAGQRVGLSGTAGSGPHLHWELVILPYGAPIWGGNKFLYLSQFHDQYIYSLNPMLYLQD